MPQGMGGEFQRVEANAAHPFRDEARVLACGQGPIWASAPREQVLPGLAAGEVPIVVPLMADPVGVGLVASLARPGGNVTGPTSRARPLFGLRAIPPLH